MMTCRFLQISFQCPRTCDSNTCTKWGTAPKTLNAQKCSEISRKTRSFLGDFITQVQKQSFTKKVTYYMVHPMISLQKDTTDLTFLKGLRRSHISKQKELLSDSQKKLPDEKNTGTQYDCFKCEFLPSEHN